MASVDEVLILDCVRCVYTGFAFRLMLIVFVTTSFPSHFTENRENSGILIRQADIDFLDVEGICVKYDTILVMSEATRVFYRLNLCRFIGGSVSSCRNYQRMHLILDHHLRNVFL